MAWDLRIDGDALVYIAGHRADSKSGPLSHSIHSLKLVINSIINKLQPCHVTVYLTAKDPSYNFRHKLMPLYKQNRNKCTSCGTNNLAQTKQYGYTPTGGRFLIKICQDCGTENRAGKPIFYNELRKYLIKRYNAIVCDWGEADDWLGMDYKDNTIIASHDKDLLMIPCKHWRIREQKGIIVKDPGKLVLNDKRDLKGTGLVWFIAQTILGDTADNIPSALKGLGAVNAYKRLNITENLKEQYEIAKTLFISSNTNDNWIKRCQVLWISRRHKEIWTEDMFIDLIGEIECSISKM